MCDRLLVETTTVKLFKRRALRLFNMRENRAQENETRSKKDLAGTG
jgi:hypothetical protein